VQRAALRWLRGSLFSPLLSLSVAHSNRGRRVAKRGCRWPCTRCPMISSPLAAAEIEPSTLLDCLDEHRHRGVLSRNARISEHGKREVDRWILTLSSSSSSSSSSSGSGSGGGSGGAAIIRNSVGRATDRSVATSRVQPRLFQRPAATTTTTTTTRTRTRTARIARIARTAVVTRFLEGIVFVTASDAT